jgi:hypothetical protein
MKSETKLRQLLIVILPALVLVGCTASSTLQSALGSKYRYSLTMAGPEKSNNMLYRDEQLLIQFRLDEPGLRFQAQNISPDSMRIDWAKATISVRGVISPIRTIATFYDTTGTQPARQVLPSLGVVRDVIVPRGNVYFDGAQWHVDDLLPTTDANKRSMRITIAKLLDSIIEVQLPIECGTDVRSYKFSFSVNSIRQISWSDYRVATWIPPHPPVKGLRPSAQDNLTAVIIGAGFMIFLRYLVSINKVPVVE